MSEKKIDFYSPKNILKKDATYNVIFGERSNGKTYSILNYAIEQYFKTNGGQLAIVRRWKEDVTGKRASRIFDGINEQGADQRRVHQESGTAGQGNRSAAALQRRGCTQTAQYP